MCGIAGIWKLNNSTLQLEDIKRFTDALFHRGPDGSGYSLYNNNQLGFGHRRLSILDLTESGRQPMEFGEGKYAITFNGEIYNFLELRKELKTYGYTFRTDTDTEVILAAYHKWGKNCLKKFNGMFAFAIWDNDKQSLFVARDRFGVKPLHIMHIPGEIFAFASETIAFKHLNGYQRSIDSDLMCRSIQSFSSIEAYGYTIFEHILQVLPGHYFEYNGKNAIEQKRWWHTLDNLVSTTHNYEQQVEEFKSIFMDACKLRLRSDVPVASALSGGVDSSAVYCMLHHMMKTEKIDKERIQENWQKAFIATFPNTKVDERKYAEKVVEYTGGEAAFLIPDYSNLIKDIEHSTILFDGISGTPIICLTDVYKAMRNNGIIVSMDGHGVDEMMYGYRNSVYQLLWQSLENDDYDADSLKEIYLGMLFPEEREKKTIEANELYQIKKTENPVIKFLRKAKNQLRPKKSTVFLPNVESHSWLKHHNYNQLPFLTGDFLADKERQTNEPIIFDHFHYSELPYNLRDFDRGSMQHGIEIRMPFMDYRLVSLIFSIDRHAKIGNGYTKRILRDAMSGIMPEEIRTRKLKIGLGSPMKEWFEGIMAEYLMDEVSSNSFQQSIFWDGKKIKSWVDVRYKEKDWSDHECSQFWPYLNAHLIANKG
ncbi:MAG: asparagine synthase (glutamine-hydrolyzing) [Chitinophagales bacterium]|nr:asparagine synthase (glutamine-hydrolyzing) [Chitinophagales bacterium]